MSAQISVVWSHAPKAVKVSTHPYCDQVLVDVGELTLYLTPDSARSLAAQLERSAADLEARTEAA